MRGVVASAAIAGGFFALNLPRVLRHAMWRDELQAWLIARDSPTLCSLFHNLRYEGHPGLWHLSLWLLRHASARPTAMALFHLLIGSAVVGLFVRKSPFPLPVRLLFALGYFPLFEYLVLCRGYSLGVLCAFGFCAVRSPWLRGLMLLLLCQTSIYGVLLAAGLAVLALGEARFAVLAPLLAGVVLCALQVIPPADSQYSLAPLRWDAHRLAQTVAQLQSAFTLAPPLGTDFAAAPVFERLTLPCRVVLALALAALVGLGLRRRPAAALGFFVGALGVLGFGYLHPYASGDLHHIGTLFVLLLACAWLTPLSRLGVAALTVLLLVQAGAGVAVSIHEYRHPLSAGRATAAYIERQGLGDRMLLVGGHDSAASAVAGYLRAPLYYANRAQAGTFVIWDRTRRRLTEPELRERMARLAQTSSRELLLISNAPLSGLTPLARFEDSLLESERFYLYHWRSIIRAHANHSTGRRKLGHRARQAAWRRRSRGGTVDALARPCARSGGAARKRKIPAGRDAARDHRAHG